MSDFTQNSLLGLDRAEMASLIERQGASAYRVQQLLDAVYRQRVETIETISTLPQSLRRQLAEKGVSIGLPVIEKRFFSQDGTERYLVRFDDGQTVESVWMPDGDGGEAGDGSEVGDSLNAAQLRVDQTRGSPSARSGHVKEGGCRHMRGGAARSFDRATICISSQVGCAVDCQFCLTAQLGVKRNLTAGEIVGQVCAVLNDHKVSPPEDRINLVFMGMGEPFLNYDHFMKAVRLLVQEVGIAETRMTVSTAGIVPRIYDFGLEPVRPKLAISLNASNDALRTQLMPLNRKWNLERVLAAAREFPLRPRERITFEYVLLSEVNDSLANAGEVVELLRGLRAKVNLIALNAGPGIDFATPTENRIAEFRKVLINAGIPAFVRRPRGRDIYAACGQLKRTVEVVAAPQ